jgi:hypothetical protein
MCHTAVLRQISVLSKGAIDCEYLHIQQDGLCDWLYSKLCLYVIGQLRAS